MSNVPPKWVFRFLAWFCRSDLYEFIEGDLTELYELRSVQKGRKYANTSLIWDVIRFIRPSNSSIFFNFNQNSMIRNYLKVGMRSLRKNWANSLINISGLTLSVGCAITTFIFADFIFNLNAIHPNLDKIYQVVSHIEENQQDVLYGPSPTILADRMATDIPEVKETVRVQYENANVKFGANVFRERIQFADPSFLEVFDFPLITGQKQSFEAGQIFISSEMVIKYFGSQDPIGQRLDMKFDDQKRSFTVGGVFGKVPANVTFKPQLLLNFEAYQGLFDAKTNWIEEVDATFFLVEDDQNLPSVYTLLQDYTITQNTANSDQPIHQFELISFQELTLNGNIRQKIIHGNDRSGTIGIAITGLMLIVFACLNYVNIAISSSATRLKEIGVRKVMGSSRLGIAQQFLVENFLICAFAMVFGLVACYFVLLPAFNQLVPIEIPFSFSSWSTATIYFIGLFVFLGLLSGSYPAFYISKFQSLKIFRGEKKLGGKSTFSKILLTGQFTLVFITILGCLVFTDNARYVKDVSWGYEPDGILSIPVADDSQFSQLEKIVAEMPLIDAYAGSKGHIGIENPLTSFDFLNEPIKILQYAVGSHYLQMMGLPLLDGKYFDENSDKNSVVINELFAKRMKWDTPIGQSFDFDGERKTVVGVVGNVYHAFFDRDIQRPMVFTTNQNQSNFLVVKVDPKNVISVNEYLSDQWPLVAPYDPYVSFFQSDVFDRNYDNVDSNIWFMTALSILTIFLSCLGLHGLLAVTLQNRLKEFGIRKVLGASGNNILLLANREFIWIMAISFGLGAPIGVFVMRDFVASFFTIAKPFSLAPILLGIGVTVGTILVSVLGQVRKVSKVNPVEVLKGD